MKLNYRLAATLSLALLLLAPTLALAQKEEKKKGEDAPQRPAAAKPGIRPMTRRLSVYEAITEAGGILNTGKSQVVVLHWDADRMLKATTIDIAAIRKGKTADNYFLRPGDQVFVPGNRWKTVEAVLKLAPILSFARSFS